MKFSIALALVAVATVVSAETNAARLARGLSPNAPGKRATPVVRARHSTPSGGPVKCNTGSAHCCTSVGKSGQSTQVDALLELLGVKNVTSGTRCGMDCSSMTGSSASCKQQSVCCEHNDYGGIINIGCSPINIG